MAKYVLLVMSEPTPGMEDEFNDWYSNGHMQDVLATPGIQTARRLKVCEGYEADLRYGALYEIETDDPHGLMARLNACAANEWGPQPALGPATVTLLECITPVLRSE